VDPGAVDQDTVIGWLGLDHISPAFGLHHGDHSALRSRVYDPDHFGRGLRAESVWIGSFDELYALARDRAPLQLSGAQWYHHVAVRGVSGDNIWIANSAPGYLGIFETLNRQDYARLGTWRATWVR
jgi:hypothetical protein